MPAHPRGPRSSMGSTKLEHLDFGPIHPAGRRSNPSFRLHHAGPESKETLEISEYPPFGAAVQTGPQKSGAPARLLVRGPVRWLRLQGTEVASLISGFLAEARVTLIQ